MNMKIFNYLDVSVTLKKRCKNHVFETINNASMLTIINTLSFYTFGKVLYQDETTRRVLYFHNKFENETLVLIVKVNGKVEK